MLSPGGARGVEKAELNGNVDSDNNHGGSSRTYVLHRARCSQEDDQLLRQGCGRPGSPRRRDRSNALGTGRLDEDASATLDRGDGGNDFHWLDLRSPAPACSAGEGSASTDAAATAADAACHSALREQLPAHVTPKDSHCKIRLRPELSATFDHDRHSSTDRSNLVGGGGRLCMEWARNGRIIPEFPPTLSIAHFPSVPVAGFLTSGDKR